MTDEAFARAFEDGSVAPAQFDHTAHVRVAWVYLQEARAVDEALSRMRDGIRRFAAAAGVPQKYHAYCGTADPYTPLRSVAP